MRGAASLRLRGATFRLDQAGSGHDRRGRFTGPYRDDLLVVDEEITGGAA